MYVRTLEQRRCRIVTGVGRLAVHLAKEVPTVEDDVGIMPHAAVDETQLVEAAELERIAALGWHGSEEEWLGGWLLRAGNGFTGRANSALPLGDPGVPTAEAVEAIAAWYRARSLRPLVQVPLPLCADVDAVLDAGGWRAFNLTQVLVGELMALVAKTADRDDLPAATYAAAPSPGWLSGYHYRGKALPAGAEQILVLAADPVFVMVQDGDEVLAVGRGVVDEGWLGVTAVTVADSHRRRGLGTHVMRALAHWALDRGADRLYLQVAADNAAALQMYRHLGLERHHEYHYRTLDPT